MSEAAYNAKLRRAKEAKEIRDILNDIYPGKSLVLARLLGIRDRVIGDHEVTLLIEFYSKELREGEL